MSVTSSELPNSETILQAAIAMEPIDLPVDYQALPQKPSRNEILEVRIAQNVGPLFGVPNPEGPFGEMSWLCTYSNINLEDIGRGAPKPPTEVVRQMQAAGVIDSSGAILPADGAAPDFIQYNRYIYGKTPNHIVAASLHKFGPDAKAAVVLTGVNMLFRNQATLLAEACQTDTFQELSPTERIKTYGAMILGVYRPQPLLIAAGISAQNVQKTSLPTAFSISPRLNLSENSRARCEVGGIEKEAAPHQPLTLDVIDSSLTHLVTSLRRKKLPRPGFDTEHSLAFALHDILRNARLKEVYDAETGRGIAGVIDSPEAIVQEFLRCTPHVRAKE